MINKDFITLMKILALFIIGLGFYLIPKDNKTFKENNISKSIPDKEIDNVIYINNENLEIEINHLRNENLELMKKNKALVGSWNECNMNR